MHCKHCGSGKTKYLGVEAVALADGTSVCDEWLCLECGNTTVGDCAPDEDYDFCFDCGERVCCCDEIERVGGFADRHRAEDEAVTTERLLRDLGSGFIPGLGIFIDSSDEFPW